MQICIKKTYHAVPLCKWSRVMCLVKSNFHYKYANDSVTQSYFCKKIWYFIACVIDICVSEENTKVLCKKTFSTINYIPSERKFTMVFYYLIQKINKKS